jgi:hypothetical protein
MKRSALILIVALAGCGGGGSGTPEADEFFYDCNSMAKPSTLTVFATDESFTEFINKEVANGFTKDDAQAPKLTSPASGGTISAATPPQFSFTVGGSASREARTIEMASRPLAVPLWRRVVHFLGDTVEGTAYAHCPQVNGQNYLFRVTPEGNDKKVLYTALLSVTSFTPAADRWSKALSGMSGKAVNLTLASAVYSGGNITNGPFVATAPIRFTVGP